MWLVLAMVGAGGTFGAGDLALVVGLTLLLCLFVLLGAATCVGVHIINIGVIGGFLMYKAGV